MARYQTDATTGTETEIDPAPLQAAELRGLFDAQRERRWTMARSSAAERVEKLRRLKGAILERAPELYAAIRTDLRKHPTESELTELQPVVGEINHAISHLARWMRPRRVGTPLTLFGTRSEVRYEAKGVVLILSPWNYPFLLTVDPLVAAIAAGNCAIIKPSEKTPATSAFMRSLVEGVFEADEVAVVEGEADAARALLEFPFDHIFFTGSGRIGRVVMEAAAKNLTPVTLELGGKSPAIVDESVDLERAAKRIVWGKFINAGQTCVAPDYVLLPRASCASFVDFAKQAVVSRYGDSPDARRASMDFARVVDRPGVERLRALVSDAVSRGATIEIGGDSDVDSKYFSPTILANVDPASQVMQEEIFGPILPILTYETVDDALAVVRSGAKPLALYVFSNRSDAVDRIIGQTTAGGTVVNNVVLHLANPDLPFGGVGESGMGNYHGEFGFKTFSHERAVMRQGSPDLFRYLYPPYTPKVRGLVDRVTRWYHG